jgi:flagellar L-ring protein precursor FlgH
VKTINLRKQTGQQLLLGILILAVVVPSQSAWGGDKKSKKDPAQLRVDYISRLQEQDAQADPSKTVGSLWSPGGNPLGDVSTDYKAQKLNDTIVIMVSVQTTAAQSGTSSYQRTVATSNGITGLPGDLKTTGLNPLFNANSSTQLAGQGATSTNTAFQTSLTGQVIAILPSGNLVVEAQRKIFMNHQHEDITIHGVVRPRDIGPNNTISSSALSNLEVEMKGKGIISDSTRPLNPITKAILWLVGL